MEILFDTSDFPKNKIDGIKKIIDNELKPYQTEEYKDGWTQVNYNEDTDSVDVLINDCDDYTLCFKTFPLSSI